MYFKIAEIYNHINKPSKESFIDKILKRLLIYNLSQVKLFNKTKML